MVKTEGFRREVQVSNAFWPGIRAESRARLVAGAGFEPATSGCHQVHRDYYGLGPEATDSLGVVRDSPSLPVSGYPSSDEWNGANVDSKWTRLELRSGLASGHSRLLDALATAPVVQVGRVEGP